jgi:hypothetical protein
MPAATVSTMSLAHPAREIAVSAIAARIAHEKIYD